MGNSSISVQQALGSFNFAPIKGDNGELECYRASININRFVVIRHISAPRAPTKYGDPVTVSVYGVQRGQHYRVWARSYDSITQFLSAIHSCVPWDSPLCDVPWCESKPILDGSKCEKHTEQ